MFNIIEMDEEEHSVLGEFLISSFFCVTRTTNLVVTGLEPLLGLEMTTSSWVRDNWEPCFTAALVVARSQLTKLSSGQKEQKSQCEDLEHTGMPTVVRHNLQAGCASHGFILCPLKLHHTWSDT